VFFLFVEVNGDPGCTNSLYFKQRLSHSKIGLLEEHTRIKPAAPSPAGRGSYLSLSLLPSFLRKLFDFCHLYAKRLGTQRPIVSKYSRSVSNGFLCALEACGWFGVALKINYLFGCFRGTLAITKILSAFSSHPKVLATLMGPVESLRTWSSLAFIRKLKGTFCL